MPRVARVLDHLGVADAGAEERRLDVLVERLGRRRIRGVVVPDQRQRRLAEVLQRGAFAQELGVDRDAEPFAVLLAGCPLERRNDVPVRRPRQHGAANDDDVIGGLVAKHRADLLADADQIRQVEAAVPAARRARRTPATDRVELHRVGGARRRAQLPGANALLKQLAEARARRSGCGLR